MVFKQYAEVITNASLHTLKFFFFFFFFCLWKVLIALSQEIPEDWDIDYILWLILTDLYNLLYALVHHNKRVRNLAVSKEPWDISEAIRDINKNIPGLGPQKKYSSRATSAAEKACLSKNDP